MWTVKWVGDSGSDDCHHQSLIEAVRMMRRKWQSYSGAGHTRRLRCVSYLNGEFVEGFWILY